MNKKDFKPISVQDMLSSLTYFTAGSIWVLLLTTAFVAASLSAAMEIAAQTVFKLAALTRQHFLNKLQGGIGVNIWRLNCRQVLMTVIEIVTPDWVKKLRNSFRRWKMAKKVARTSVSAKAGEGGNESPPEEPAQVS